MKAERKIIWLWLFGYYQPLLKSALNKTTGRYCDSQLCHCSWLVAGSIGKKMNSPQENSYVVNELQDLKNQIRRLTEIKFTTKQKIKRPVPVSKSQYSTHLNLALQQTEGEGEVSHCTSFSSTIRKVSAKGQGYKCAYRNPLFPAGTKGKASHIILFYMLPNASMSNAHKIYR